MEWIPRKYGFPKGEARGDPFHHVTPTGMSYLFYYTEHTHTNCKFQSCVGLVGTTKELVMTTKSVVEITKGLVVTRKGLAVIIKVLVVTTK